MTNASDNIDAADIENAIHMLKTYAKIPNIEPLVTILEALKDDPSNESLVAQLVETWRNLGVYQGTVLTYVPYFYTLIPDDIFGDDIQ